MCSHGQTSSVAGNRSVTVFGLHRLAWPTRRSLRLSPDTHQQITERALHSLFYLARVFTILKRLRNCLSTSATSIARHADSSDQLKESEAGEVTARAPADWHK